MYPEGTAKSMARVTAALADVSLYSEHKTYVDKAL
jgi:hypothetical protein